MPQVIVQDEEHLDLPSSIRKAANLRKGDTLDVDYEEGKIVFTLKTVPLDEEDGEPSDLLAMIGMNEGSGLYKDTQEIDDYIRGLREEWD